RAGGRRERGALPGAAPLARSRGDTTRRAPHARHRGASRGGSHPRGRGHEMMPRAWATAGGLAIAVVGGARAPAPTAVDLSGRPVLERPVVRRPGPLDGTLAVLLTGD